jgi:DNA-binding SARP family transcriptional activator/streptogramin lyase
MSVGKPASQRSRRAGWAVLPSNDRLCSDVIEFRLLGPFEVEWDQHVLKLTSRKERVLLALLALHRGQPMSSERLIDGLWGASPPATAAKSVQVYVSHLRRALPADVLVTRGGGYALDVPEKALDSGRFRGLLDEGRALLSTGRFEEAADILRTGLSLWRGPPLADLAYEPFAQTEIAQLEELRSIALEERIEADLALGDHAAVVPELERLIREQPLRERLRGQLMRALYASGRQAEALAAYHETRRVLRDELGLVPSPALRELERAILAQDAALAPPTAPRPLPIRPRGPPPIRRPRRRRLRALGLVAAAALVAALAGTTIFAREDGARALASVSADAIGIIDPRTDTIVGEVSLTSAPGAIAYGRGSLWVAGIDANVVWRVNPRTRIVEQTFPVGSRPDDIAVGAGAVWVASSQPDEVVRIDPASGAVDRIPIPRPMLRRDAPFGACHPGSREGAPAERTYFPILEESFSPGAWEADVAVADGHVWFSCEAGTLARIDPDTRAAETMERADDNHPTAGWAISLSPVSLVYGHGSLWAANSLASSSGALWELDQSTGASGRVVELPGLPRAIAVGGTWLWVGTHGPDALWRLKVARSRVVPVEAEPVPLADPPDAVRVGEGSVWVVSKDAGTLARLDPVSRQVRALVTLGTRPHSLAIGGGAVWVTTGQALPPETDDNGAVSWLQPGGP